MNSVIASISKILSSYDIRQAFLSFPAPYPSHLLSSKSILVLLGRIRDRMRTQGAGRNLEICFSPPKKDTQYVPWGPQSSGRRGEGPWRHLYFSAPFL